MSAIVEYMRGAWPEALATAEDVRDKICEAGFEGMVYGRETWLSSKIDDWSHRTLPPATANVASAVLIGLPFTALGLFAPTPVAISIHSGLFVVRNVARENGHLIDDVSLNGLASVNGVGLAGVVHGVRDTFFTHRNSLLVMGVSCMGVSWLPYGIYLLTQSGFMRNCVNAAGELIDKVVEHE